MFKLRLKNLQTAQGMVEFALVLPLLLLLILGIFAFGHLFFVYSSVVSASREAARWGAAVGEAPSSFPRYQDCASIRAAAVRVGSFAGVNATDLDLGDPADSGVSIDFDHGPDLATGDPTIYASCPEGGEGPEDVQMGDRILVRVRVNYTPIVPIVNLPSFPLEATTSRTILRSVPVGEAPTAVDPCTTMTTIQLTADPEPSVVGQEVIYTVTVTADDGTTPTGTITLHDYEDPMFAPPEVELVDGSYIFTTYPAVYWTPGDKPVAVQYTSDNTCHVSSSTTVPGPDPIHQVLASPTEILLDVSPAVGQTNQSLTLNVRVQALTPGAGMPTGFVMVTYPGPGSPSRVDLVDGVGVLVVPPPIAPGSFTFSVVYPDTDPEDADPNYAESTASITRQVIMPSPTPQNTLTPTPLPPLCPSLASNFNFDAQQDGFVLGIRNNDPDNDIKVTSVGLTWPELPTAKLQEIHFAPSTVTGCGGGSSDCLWNNNGGENPPSATINNSNNKWKDSNAGLARGQTKEMRMVFNANLPNGTFRLVVNFSNGCVLDVSADRLVVQ